MERQYKNLGYFLLILAALVAAGFYKPYFALIPNFDPSITPLVQFHALDSWVIGSMSRAMSRGWYRMRSSMPL